MRDLPRRTVTAVVYGVLVVVALLLPDAVFAVLLALAAAIALAELLRLRRAGWLVVIEGVLVAAGLLSLGVLRVATRPLGYLLPAALGGSASPPDVLAWPASVAVPFALLLVLLSTWAADVAAYLVGSTVGRHKLAPRISPGKTWEGTIAGFVAATLVFLVLHGAPASREGLVYAPVVAVALAALLGPAGLAGDLLESVVKRRAGVKDSGTLLPGHGGVLDRIDSLVATATLAVVPLLVGCCGPGLG